MVISKTRLISCCKKYNIDTTGLAKQLAEKLNNHFGANYFNYNKKCTCVEIDVMHWNRLEKEQMAHKKQASLDLKQCPYCKNDYPAKTFRNVSGSIKKHCLECRKLLGEK
jgi:hypothetical protein